jgi:acyl carrier protein
VNAARALLIEVAGLSARSAVAPSSASLLDCGVDSGDLIRLVLLVEERYGVDVGVDELDQLTTIAALESLIRRADGLVREDPQCG